MELRGEYRKPAVPEALERPVVQVAMRRLDLGGQRGGVDRKAVVLRRDRNVPRLQVLDRMVRPAVPELQLEGLRAEREAE